MTTDWIRGDTIVTVESPWARMVAERWRDDKGRELDYWRVEHVHSVIVAAVHNGSLLLPQPQFRPGLGVATLDLPGGRLPEGADLLATAASIVARELGLPAAAVGDLRQLNRRGWPVNSSFSNQLVFGLTATIDQAAVPTLPCEAIPADRAGILALLDRMACLQCRAVLFEVLRALI